MGELCDDEKYPVAAVDGRRVALECFEDVVDGLRVVEMLEVDEGI